VFAGEAEENDIVAVDAWTLAEPANQTLAPACKLCDCHRLPRHHLDRFRHSFDLDALSKLTSRETLASAELSRVHAAAVDDDDGQPSIAA
jgi:hypothetical protein